MLQRLLMQQRPLRLEHFNHLIIRLKDMLASKQWGVWQKNTITINRILQHNRPDHAQVQYAPHQYQPH